MNINKFTQKSLEAVNNCEKLAYQYGNPEIDQEHFLYSLLTVDDSLIAKLIEKMEINRDSFQAGVMDLIEKKPKVSGGQTYISKSLNQVLVSAEDVKELRLRIYSSTGTRYNSRLLYHNIEKLMEAMERLLEQSLKAP